MAWSRALPVCRQARSYATRSVPHGHWTNPENQRAFMDSVAASFGIRNPEDWKDISTADFKAKGGGTLLNLHGGSLLRALQAVYPEQSLDAVSCRRRVPQGYWKKRDHRRRFLLRLRDSLRLSAEDWHGDVTLEHVKEAGGTTLLHMFGDNVKRLLADAFPELNVEIGERKPPGYWTKWENRKACLDDIARQLGIREDSEWARVPLKKVRELGGTGLLKHYSNSLPRALEDVYPNMTLSPYNSLGRRRKGYWDDTERRRRFLDEYAKSRDIRSREDWKKATWRDIVAAGGGSLLSKYTCIEEALGDIYGGEWLTHECRPSVPRKYWTDEANVRSFLDFARRELRIQSDEDWYRVSGQQLRSLNGGSLLSHMTLRDALERAYGMRWDDSKAEQAGKRSSQRLLMCHVKDIMGVPFHQEVSQ